MKENILLNCFLVAHVTLEIVCSSCHTWLQKLLKRFCNGILLKDFPSNILDDFAHPLDFLSLIFFNSEILDREINDISPNMLSRNFKLLDHSTFFSYKSFLYGGRPKKRYKYLDPCQQHIGVDWNILSNIENV